jgi:hypothetical protein
MSLERLSIVMIKIEISQNYIIPRRKEEGDA